MATFTVHEFRDLLQLLDQRPEWREELRQRVLGEDLLTLPRLVQDLARAQQRTEQRLEALTARVDALTEQVQALTERVDDLARAQERTEQRLEVLTERVDALTEQMQALTARVDALTARVEDLARAQERTEQRLEVLTERVDVLTARVDALTVRVDALTVRVDALTEQMQALTARVEDLTRAQQRTERRLDALYKEVRDLRGRVQGKHLEDAYQANPFRFRSLLHRPTVLNRAEITDLIATAAEAGRLSGAEAYDLGEADLFVRGFHKREGRPLWLVVEVSQTVYTEDVDMAIRRAGLLAGALREPPPAPEVLAVVAGEAWAPQVEATVQQGRVTLLQDGQLIAGRRLVG